MSTTPYTDAIIERLISTEDGEIFDSDDAQRLLAILRKLEAWSYSGPCPLDGIMKALRNGRGDTHLQGRLLDVVLFPAHQEIKP